MGGRVVFNETSYDIYHHLPLVTGTSIEGLASFGSSAIRRHVGGAGTAVFYIGPGVHHIAIRDVALVNGAADPSNGLKGIHAVGAGISSPNSTHFTFDNLAFYHFDKGFHVETSVANDGWQFDNAKLSNSFFVGCNWGVHLDSHNANMEMHNLVFNNGRASESNEKVTGHPFTQNGVWIEQSGYVVMTYLVGNGSRDPKTTYADAGEFLRIEQRSFVNINSTIPEGYRVPLVVKGYEGYKFMPITITNSGFAACRDDGSIDGANPPVSFHNATIVSSGNGWGCAGVGRPIVTGTSDIYSTGDKFCSDQGYGGSVCEDSGVNGEWLLQSDKAVLRTDHNVLSGNLWSPVTEILAGIDFDDRPLLSLAINDFGSSVTKYMYNFRRNSSTERLEIQQERYDGEDTPVTDAGGFYFKGGPVQLHSATQSQLSSYSGSGDNGSMLYCSDCTAPSTPCSGSGGGALALKVGSQWHCK